MKLKLVSVAASGIIALLAFAIACGNNDIVFPEHDAPLGTDRGGEYFAGKLVVSKGCLRAEAPSYDAANPQSSWLLIWPATFMLEAESGSVRIVDGLGRVAAQVGDHIRISRAEVTHQQAMEQGLVKDLAEDCAEPYFLVGDEVTVFDPKNEATELRLSDPDVLFLRKKTVMGFPSLLEAEGIGELVLDGQCLRLDDSNTIVWPAGFTPHIDQGVVQVRNGAGRVIATVGDEIAAGGGYSSLDGGVCSGEVFAPNRIKVLPDVEAYFPRQNGTLTMEQETERFAGELILDGKCLKIDDPLRMRDRVYLPISLLLVWPSSFSLSVDDEEVGIVDATGRIVARIGDEVQFSGLSLSYQQAIEHGGLEEILPACSGSYWAVGEDFTASAHEVQ